MTPGGVAELRDERLAGAPPPWYSARETRRFFAAWAREDRYLPLALEVKLLESAGFRVDVPWRRAPFGLVVGSKPR